MATSGVYPTASNSAPRVVALPQQKKILEDVLECIIKLKAEFFENQQPINDDNVTLQRLCAKLEHLIQMGMKEKSSLLGRKKDYWDYFCDTLGSAKGFNDGIRYVKSLRESKTSLGRGRGFIRFCLVHQRLADAFQQSIAHDKTSLWFLPSSVVCKQRDATSLISALYDLNSMHFDLAPRGYDLDSAWPSFANRATSAISSWNIPISRRSSITSMDTVSQISVCMSEAADVDKLHKDLEAAQSAQNDTQEQLGALQKEKEDFSHAVWESQGQVSTLQDQLKHCRAELASLQTQHRDLDVSFVKLKMEKDHLETLLSQERKNVKEQESRRVQQLQGEEGVWKREMREEGERRRREMERLQEDLKTKVDEEDERNRKVQHYCDSLLGLMSVFKIEPTSQEDFQSNIGHIETWMNALQTQMDEMKGEKMIYENQAAETSSNHDKIVQEFEKHQEEMATINENLTASVNRVSSLESELSKKCEECDSIKAQLVVLEKYAEDYKEEMEMMKDQISELNEKEKDLKEMHHIMKEYFPDSAKNLLGNKLELENYLKKVFENEKLVVEYQRQVNELKKRDEGKEEKLNDMEEMMNILNIDMEEKEERLSSVLSELQTTKAISVKVEKEVDVYRHAGQAINEQLSVSEARIEILTSKSKDEERKVTELTAILEKMKGENELKTVVEKERDELRIRVDDLTVQKATVSKTVEDLNKSIEDGQKNRAELQADLHRAQAELEDKKKELTMEKDRMMVLLTNSEQVEKSDTERSEQISNLLGQNEAIRREKEEALLLLEKEKDEWKKKLEEKENERTKMISDMETLREKESATEALWKSQIEKSDKDYIGTLHCLNKEVVQALRQCQNTLEVKSDSINGEQEPYREDKGLLKEELNRNVLSLCDQIKQVTEIQREADASLQENSSLLEEEKGQLLGQIDAALDETRSIKSQLEETSDQLAASNSNLDTILSEKESLEFKISAMMEDIAKHESEKDQLRREVGVLKRDCERAEDEGQEKLSEKRKLEVQLEEVEEQLQNVLGEKSKLEKTVEEFYSQTEFSHQVLEDSLVDSQDALEAMRVEKIALEEKCSSLEKGKISVDESLQSAMEECQALKSGLNNVAEKSQSFSESANEERIHILEEEKARYELEIDTLNSEISSLQFQLSSEFIQKQTDMQTSGSGTGSHTHVEELEEEVKRLEGENEELRKWKEEEEGSKSQNNSLYIQIKSLEEMVEHYDMKIKKMEANLSDAISSRDKMSLKVTELQFSSAKKLEARDKELETLRSDNEGMKKQILKLTKAKDNLWQKTDALVDERKRKASEKWQDNSEVTKCGLCRAEFTLFVRKHHCRQCGHIFCWSCSDNWLDTTHSSKKARVCKTCFEQQSNPDASLATSLLENDSDNDDEEGSSRGSTNYIHTFEGGRVHIREVSPQTAAAFRAKNGGDNDDDDDDAAFNSTTNETDEGKLMQRPHDPIPSAIPTGPAMETEDRVYSSPARNSGANDDNDLDSVDDFVFEVITEADVIKTVTDYEARVPAASNQANMASSMMLEADDLESGEVNRQNEVWIKPGRKFSVPIKIGGVGGTILSWEFSSHPKDIVFSIYFCADENISMSEAEEIVSPCKCDAHKQMHRGELTAKRPGIYTLVFDNTYSRMTSKKVHYHLEYRKASQH